MLCLFTDPKKTYNKQITKKTLAPVFPDHILNFSMNICIVLICQNALAENSSCWKFHGTAVILRIYELFLTLL